MEKGIQEQYFGELQGQPVTAYKITNGNAMQVTVINYGATVTKIITPDRDGNPGNVVLGFDELMPYLQNGGLYLGSIVGRYCNRIGGAKFELNETEYRLAANNETECLHGGLVGFDKVLWQAEQVEDCVLQLTYLSKDGEEGFPGNLQTALLYTLTDENELIIDYTGTTDKPTPVNLTSHSYFNLSAGKELNILNHELSIFSDEYTTPFIEPGASELSAPVKNTALDFNVAKKIGRDIQQLPSGYDHNYVLNKSTGKAAEVYEPGSGRLMEVFTTEPGLQFYSANFLSLPAGNIRDSKNFIPHGAFCLEAQHYPNSPNEPLFPNTILQPGATYRQTTIYKFSVK